MTHSISYKGAGIVAHSEVFPDQPSEAVAGESVSVVLSEPPDNVRYALTDYETIGIADALVLSVSDKSQLEQSEECHVDIDAPFTYTFTMPDHDVTVWILCEQTGGHKIIVI